MLNTRTTLNYYKAKCTEFRCYQNRKKDEEHCLCYEHRMFKGIELNRKRNWVVGKSWSERGAELFNVGRISKLCYTTDIFRKIFVHNFEQFWNQNFYVTGIEWVFVLGAFISVYSWLVCVCVCLCVNEKQI